jgi:hypothetical protein
MIPYNWETQGSYMRTSADCGQVSDSKTRVGKQEKSCPWYLNIFFQLFISTVDGGS